MEYPMLDGAAAGGATGTKARTAYQECDNMFMLANPRGGAPVTGTVAKADTPFV